jgi:uncharacterized tellurite resistance protein B-like protein
MEARVAKALLLAKVLVADGMITADERNFLDAAVGRLGLTEDERAQVASLEGWDDAETVVAKLAEDERRAWLDVLVEAASADGRLSKLEVDVVRRISAALGL